MIQNCIFLISSVNNNPLKYWTVHQSMTGSVRSVLDQHLLQNVIELRDKSNNNFEKTWITCPSETDKILNIKLPFLVLVVKKCDANCMIKLQIIDKCKIRHYLYFYSDSCDKRYTTKIPNSQLIEINYEKEWNRIELDLSKLIWQAFQTNYEAIQRIQICGNIRIRRIYCIDKHYSEFEISTKLCQNFFEFYMSKWGNRLVERFTQTEKNKCSSTNQTENVAIIHLNANNSDKKINPYFEKLDTVKSKKIEANFSKFLRTSCRKTVDNFFNINSKSACCMRNPKLESLTTSGVEKQKILLATVKFINNIQNTHFSLIK